MPMTSCDTCYHGFYWAGYLAFFFFKCVCMYVRVCVCPGAGTRMNGYLEASDAILNNVISLLREGSLMGTC